MNETTKKFADLSKRLATALLGAATIITCVTLNEWLYLLIFFIICYFSLMEFYKLSMRDGFIVQRILGVISGIVIFFVPFFVERGMISYRWYFAIFPLMSCIFLIKLYKKNEAKPFTNIAYTFLGVIYAAVPFALLHVAAFESGRYNYQIIVGCLFILWSADTGAYFAGNWFGKRKLFERISPKKTWEGALGGLILASLFALFFTFYFTTLVWWQWTVITVVIVVCSIYGDLVESLMKRSMEIKDSGNSIPGHGGFLDRFDGLFIAAPFIVAFLELFPA